MMAVAHRNTDDGDGGPGPFAVADYLAAANDATLNGRASPLDVALAGLAEELAAARCEIVALERENTELRSRLTAPDALFWSEGP